MSVWQGQRWNISRLSGDAKSACRHAESYWDDFFKTCLLPNLGVAVLCWSAPKVCLHWIALHACKNVRPCPLKYRAKIIALETGQCRTPERKSQQWLGFRSWLLSPTPFLHNRTEWFDDPGPRTRWFDTLCFAPVGSWNYGLWLSLTYDPLIFLNGWLWYPIKKLYLSMQVFVRLWFLFLTIFVFKMYGSHRNVAPTRFEII